MSKRKRKVPRVSPARFPSFRKPGFKHSDRFQAEAPEHLCRNRPPSPPIRRREREPVKPWSRECSLFDSWE